MTDINSLPTPQLTDSLPQIVTSKNNDPAVTIDPNLTAQTGGELKISDQGIADTIVYMDPKRRLLNYGTHYSNKAARLRFPSIPEIQESSGDVIRISTKVRLHNRTDKQMNRILVHELEHTAQSERNDKKVTQGRIAIGGLTLAGAILGYKLSANKALGAAGGAMLGRAIGDTIAPHERQARHRAGQGLGRTAQVTTKAISRKTK